MMHHFEVTAILHDFSSSDNSNEWELSEDELAYVRPVFKIENAKLLFYANGNCEENKGYVSIIFREKSRFGSMHYSNLKEAEVRYFFSVMDVSGNKRFTRSIVYFPGKRAPGDSKKGARGNFHFGLERYLKRQILLNDPAELLPGDCLTISVEIDYINRISRPDVELHPIVHLNNLLEFDYTTKSIKLDCITEFSFSVDECDRLCIPLDTFYGRELCSLSGFFQRAADTSLTEGKTRKVHIPDEEVVAFNNIFNILFKPIMELGVKSIKDICQLYVTADKYDFQSVIETCRQLIKAFLRTTDDSGVREHATQGVPDIIELADNYRDTDLKDTVKTYLESKESFGTNDYALGKYLKERLFTEWKCVSRGVSHQFRLSKITKPELEFYL